MSRLSIFLPPFASDYSGACSALFNLDCLIIIVDAGCCTRNYVEYDEPRWRHQRRSTFSARIRSVETIVGDDAEIISQTVEVAKNLHPACIAVVGTPVPAIVGMDLAGVAHEIETLCATPALGIPTTGFESYEVGVSMTLELLCRRFAHTSSSTNMPHYRADRPLLNILGATPHDFMRQENMDELNSYLNDQGFDIACNTGIDRSLEAWGCLSQAHMSLVVSQAGLAAARVLKQKFGIPFFVGYPFGLSDNTLADTLHRAYRQTLKEDNMYPVPCPLNQDVPESLACGALLLIGDQILMNSLRANLKKRFSSKGVRPLIHVASFFTMEATYQEPGDFFIEHEQSLISYISNRPNTYSIADPLIRRIPGFENSLLIELPHEALSSTLFETSALNYRGEAMEAALDTVVTRYQEQFGL